MLHMAKQVRLTLAKAIAKANMRRAVAGEKAITMNALAVAAGVAQPQLPDWHGMIRKRH